MGSEEKVRFGDLSKPVQAVIVMGWIQIVYLLVLLFLAVLVVIFL